MLRLRRNRAFRSARTVGCLRSDQRAGVSQPLGGSVHVVLAQGEGVLREVNVPEFGFINAREPFSRRTGCSCVEP